MLAFEHATLSIAPLCRAMQKNPRENTAVRSMGAVTGRLEGLNLHAKREFFLYPPVPGCEVRCIFPPDLLDDVCRGINRVVTVSGILEYRLDKPFPDTVQAEKIEIHPPDATLPGLADLRGQSPACTGDTTAVDFVRAVRNEQD